ncbi:MAG: glucuronate isomerase [Bacteroidota bacterium]
MRVQTIQNFISEDFLLSNDYSQQLYEQVRDLPIIDYHCHLSPQEIAADRQFENITQIWLAGDHYKWRAMRTNGVDEHFITGEASDWEKFLKYAETLPYTLRNPLYHWSHLELKRYFGVDELLTAHNAREIYDHCNQLLAQPDFSTRSLLEKMRVEVVGTTDDPLDDLSHHAALANSDFEVQVLPSFRPDRAIMIDQPGWKTYVSDLEAETFEQLLEKLEERIDYFHDLGCRVSDHGLETLFAINCTRQEAVDIFNRAYQTPGRAMLLPAEVNSFQTHLLVELGKMYHERGWVQQFHLGAIRNNNGRLLRQLGADVGVDSIGDFNHAKGLSFLFDTLDETDQLARTIIYNLNPADNEVFATMIGNFADGRIPGKMQFGSGWWFLDQLDGMTRQMNALSNMGLLSRFVGMLTDSRSFLSYPRHEYFRRLLADLFGRDIEAGKLPPNLDWTGKICRDICYFNAKNYFNFHL